MNIEQYKLEIQRTWQDDISLDMQVCNAALGLVGEVGEYEHSRSMGELGDVAFYAYTLARLVGHESGGAVEPSGLTLSKIAARIAEGVKKRVFHGAENEAQLHLYIGDLHQRIEKAALCSQTGRDFLGEVLAGNIYKLRNRYPEGFKTGGGIR